MIFSCVFSPAKVSTRELDIHRATNRCPTAVCNRRIVSWDYVLIIIFFTELESLWASSRDRLVLRLRWVGKQEYEGKTKRQIR